MSSYLTDLLVRAGILNARTDDPDELSAEHIAPLDDEEVWIVADDDGRLVEVGERPAHVTRHISLAELLAGQMVEDAPSREAELAERAGFDVSWDEIYGIAGVAEAPGGWNVGATAELIRSMREQHEDDYVQVKFSVFEALAKEGASPKTVLADILARDKALDLYEAQLIEQVETLGRELATEERRLMDQIEAMQQRIEDTMKERAMLLQHLEAWQAQKNGVEDSWVEVIEFLSPKKKR